MAKTYWVSDERGILNPGERPFRSLDRALALAAKKAEECSWNCMTPPGTDNDQGNGRFLCGVLSPHGIHVRTLENGLWGEEHDIPEEKFGYARSPQRADWGLAYVVDRDTGYLADGEGTSLFTGPDRSSDQWDTIMENIASGAEIIEAKIVPLRQGRYHHLIGESNGEYPLEWRPGRGF